MRLFERSATNRRPCESNARACGPMNSPGPVPCRPTASMNSPSLVIRTRRSPSCCPLAGRGQWPSAMMMSPFAATAHAVGPMNVSSPARETPALPRLSSSSPSGLNLCIWKPRPVRLRTVAERTAVARPQVAVVVHAEAVRRHDRAFADALRDLAGRVDVVERRLRAVQHPQAAGVVRQKTDGRAPGLARPQRGPVLDHPVRIGHRGGLPYRQQLRRRRIRIVARTLAGRVRRREQHRAGDNGRRPGSRLQAR